MIKLNIFNMYDFLQTVNGCTGAVNVIYPDGKKENINKKYPLQQKLQLQHQKNRNYLRLTLDIPNPKDYLNIVFSNISNC